MTQVAKAFAPANISCIFKISDHKDPRWSGSSGVGFTVNEGVTAEVSRSTGNRILFNNVVVQFPTVEYVAGALTKEMVMVKLTSPLPLGSGFGLSGASALATAYAINQLFSLKKSKKDLAIIAHTSEVINKTGLGDVVNQYYGGFLLKTRSSAHFEVTKLPIHDVPAYCRSFSTLLTPSILANTRLRKNINEFAEKALNKVQKLIKNEKVTFENIIKISKEFVTESGLLADLKTKNAIEEIEKAGGEASMIILGNALYSSVNFPGATKLMISDQKAHIIAY